MDPPSSFVMPQQEYKQTTQYKQTAKWRSPKNGQGPNGLENANFLAKKIIEKKFSVRQAEAFVKIFRNNKSIFKKQKDANIKDLEIKLSEKIGLNVLIKNNKRNKGTITLAYQDLDQLNKIIDIIKHYY